MYWLFKDPVVIMKKSCPDCLRIQLTVAWLNLTMPSQIVKNSLNAKRIKLPQMSFFLKKQLIKFSCTYWLLSFCKILKKFLGPIQSYEDVPFSGPEWPICHEQNFFGTNHYCYFHLPIDPFHCAQFNDDVPFLGPKWSICPKQIFFWKIVNITLINVLASFIG